MPCRSHYLTVLPVAAHLFMPLVQASEPTDGYYQQKEQGWFWGKFEPEVAVELATTQPDVLPPDPSSLSELDTDVVSTPGPATDQGPRPFSPAWLRTKLPEYRDRALENPSVENVRAYYYVQRYSVDMAERFALTAQRVVLADPFLDENSRRPLSDYGAQIFDKRARAASDAVAKKLSGEVGLWYFYRSDCPFCKAQNPVLKNLQRKLEMAILPIALDGRPMPDGQFPNFVPNRGHAEELNVQATPTIFMVKPPNDFVLLSEGLVAENSLKQRMILGAHEAGWISDSEFNATRAVNAIQIQADLGELPEAALNDPQQLVEILRAKIAASSIEQVAH